MNIIKKTTLSEIALYQGIIKMPEGFQIEKDVLIKNLLIL